MSKRKTHTPLKRRNDFDRTLRHASRQFPGDIARALLQGPGVTGRAVWADTQVTGRQRRLDRALSIEGDPDRTLLHVEWTLRMTKGIKLRVFE